MLISPLIFKEFDASAIPHKEVRKKPFAQLKKEEEPEAPPPPPTFSEEELKAAERDAYQRGFLDGSKEGHAQAQSEHTDIERILMEGLENFVSSITPIFMQYRNHCQQIKQDMPILALAIAKKVAGDALSGNFQAVADCAAIQCAELIVSEPQLTVTINTKLSDVMNDKIKKLGKRENMASQITIVPDDTIPISDYRIEWKNGSIERSVEKIWQQMDKVIADMLATIANEKEEQFEIRY